MKNSENELFFTMFVDFIECARGEMKYYTEWKIQ